MNVSEFIKELQKLPQKLEIVTHYEYDYSRSSPRVTQIELSKEQFELFKNEELDVFSGVESDEDTDIDPKYITKPFVLVD